MLVSWLVKKCKVGSTKWAIVFEFVMCKWCEIISDGNEIIFTSLPHGQFNLDHSLCRAHFDINWQQQKKAREEAAIHTEIEERALWLNDSRHLYHESWSCRSCHAQVNLVLVSMGDIMSMISSIVALYHHNHSIIPLQTYTVDTTLTLGAGPGVPSVSEGWPRCVSVPWILEPTHPTCQTRPWRPLPTTRIKFTFCSSRCSGRKIVVLCLSLESWVPSARGNFNCS